MVPPPGAIIVAPCPECQGLVVVFCGQVLALSKETMLRSTIKEKREHLMTVLTEFLRQRVGEIISEDEEPAPEVAEKPAAAKSEAAAEGSSSVMQHWRKPGLKSSPITQEEVDRFLRDDLRLIDNPDYFKAIFG